MTRVQAVIEEWKHAIATSGESRMHIQLATLVGLLLDECMAMERELTEGAQPQERTES